MATTAKTTKTAKTAASVGKERIEAILKTGAPTAAVRAASRSADQVVALSRENVEAAAKAGATAARSYDDIVAFQKENLDALLTMSTALSQGMQALSRQMLTLGQQQLEDGVAATRALLACRTVEEILDVQAGLSKTSIDKAMLQTKRIQEMVGALAERSAQPIAARVAVAVKTFGKPLAA